MAAYHTPVMLAETLACLRPVPGETHVDATLGGGGYSTAILPRCLPGGRVIGIDRDADALAESTKRLAEWRGAFIAVYGNFADMARLLANAGVREIDGAVFDLGVLSRQLDDADRGFSFRADAPLDMRMDRDRETTARDLVNTASERDLTRILRDYGEEKWSTRIARFLVEARSRGPISTTGELVRIVEAAVPRSAHPPHTHVATRTFQALRIAVNEELDALRAGLDAAMGLLRGDGRLVVISYHSLEDRIVKERIRKWAAPCICPPGMPVCGCGREPIAHPLTKGAMVPTAGEVEGNPRSRSARLRAAHRIASEKPNKTSGY